MFAIGDKVFPSQPAFDERSQAPKWVEKMDRFIGHEGTVVDVDEDFYSNHEDRVVVRFRTPCDNTWIYRESWLVPACRFSKDNEELNKLFTEME